MKKTIKFILGTYNFTKLKIFKQRYFPDKKQREKVEKEIKQISKRKLFYSKFVQNNDLCFDVGANVGNRIVPLLAIGAKVVAIEPQEDCHKFLKKKFGKKIEICTKGLGEREGVKEFHIADCNTISSFSEEWINSVKDDRFKEHKWDKVVKVEMTTLDKLISKHGLPCFIKIDVEGYELEVLKGLSKPVKMISFEYTVPEQISKVIDCIEQIEKITKNIECNYCIGEDMVFVLEIWQSVEEIKKHIHTKEFISTGFGDLYLRIKN